VLNAAADKAGWGKPLPGVHRGIAQFMGYGSYSAAVAEVSVSGRNVKVHRMVLALNCGHAVNPATIAAQVEGSVAYGFDSLLSEISIQNGRVVEQNFNTYHIARITHMPKVETVIVPTYDFWGGVGEPTIAWSCCVEPIQAATGAATLPLEPAGSPGPGVSAAVYRMAYRAGGGGCPPPAVGGAAGAPIESGMRSGCPSGCAGRCGAGWIVLARTTTACCATPCPGG
jgi:hypothetical protein